MNDLNCIRKLGNFNHKAHGNRTDFGVCKGFQMTDTSSTYAQLENSRRIEMSPFEVRGPSSHMGMGCFGLLLEYEYFASFCCFHVKREPCSRVDVP